MKDVHFSIRIPATMLIRLDKVAQATYRPRNQVINLLLEIGLNEAEAELKAGKARKYLP